MVNKCKVDGCLSNYLALGYCQKHYRRWKKHGDPTIFIPREGRTKPKYATPEERFHASFVRLSQDECWLWTGATNRQGYGLLGRTRAHRFSYELSKGSIPDKMLVCHSCDNPGCINPSHLFIGTHLDNNRDRHQKGRSFIARGSQVGNSKLKEADVRQIKELLAQGISGAEIGRRYSVSREMIFAIKTNKSWRHIVI